MVTILSPQKTMSRGLRILLNSQEEYRKDIRGRVSLLWSLQPSNVAAQSLEVTFYNWKRLGRPNDAIILISSLTFEGV